MATTTILPNIAALSDINDDTWAYGGAAAGIGLFTQAVASTSWLAYMFG